MTSFASTELYQFLVKYKLDSSESSKEKGGSPSTHTLMGKPAGAFNIPSEVKDHLIDLLHETIFVQKIPVHLTERPQQHMIIKIDLDFKFDLDQSTRKYDTTLVVGMIELYHKAIRHYMDVTDEQLKAFVFERDAPYKDKGNTKDGVHIMYPYIICDTEIQHLIREHVLLGCQTVLASMECKNAIDDIVDKSVISTNGWLMYGCSKPVAKPYRLTHVYDAEFNALNVKKFNTDNKSLIRLLSTRDHPVDQSIPIKNEHKYLIERKRTTSSSSTNAHKLKKTIKISKLTQQSRGDCNLNDIRELVKLLNSDRAEDYKSWIDVGLCLHNIDLSLLDSWIDFSRQSPKFKEGECEEQWSMMEARDGGLGIGSLHRWAGLDNPQEYTLFNRNSIAKDILKSQSQTTQDVANVIYNLYKYKYVCVSLKNNIWYEFRNHRWFEMEGAVFLKKRLGHDVLNEYLRTIIYYNQVACDQTDEDKKDDYLKKAKSLTDVTYKLRDIGFKDKIIRECQVMFYDQLFVNKLDADPNLIGFENGVYDLSTGEFRDGRPEDHITLSTGNDYLEFSEDDENISAIYTFLSQVFPDTKVRDYVVVLIASFLEGRNPNEKFHIWTGVGGNGKSKLVELFELAFGGYASKIPTALLVQKNRAASNQANPEIARLKGIRFVSAQETEENDRLNVGIMKDWTGGDRITCRPLFREPFDFKPQFKMVLGCNRLPALPPDDEGTWRRVRVVEFKSRFIDNPDPSNCYEFKRDYHLTEKLHMWKETFMYILLEHYKYYKKNGLSEPDAVKESTAEYQRTNDMYRDFLNDCLVKDEKGAAKLEEVFNYFKIWWKDNYSGKTPSRKDMKACIEKKLGKYQTNSHGGGWKGWTLVIPEAKGHGCDLDDDDDETGEVVVASGPIEA